jgi:GT2 family glycosyltransferase
LGALKEKFNYLGLSDNLKVIWNPEPMGYSRATNAGIEVATTDLIVLLNNDVVLLHQARQDWLNILATPFSTNPKCGITCVIKGPSEPAGRDFAVFFCVMVHRKVFDKIGLLNTDYGVGGGEDTEFCIEA